jgi:hypothetical protein
VGYAVSYYSPRTTTTQRQPSFHLGNPPPPRATGTGTVTDTDTGAGGRKFALFPSRTVTPTTTMNAGNDIGNATNTNTSAGEDSNVSSSPAGKKPAGSEEEKESSSASGPRVGQSAEGRGPRVVSNGAATPTLERMRDGTSVSPFSTLNLKQRPGAGLPGSGLGLSGLLGGGRKW